MGTLMTWVLTGGLWIPLDSGLFAVGLDLGPARTPKSTYIPPSFSISLGHGPNLHHLGFPSVILCTSSAGFRGRALSGR